MPPTTLDVDKKVLNKKVLLIGIIISFAHLLAFAYIYFMGNDKILLVSLNPLIWLTFGGWFSVPPVFFILELFVFIVLLVLSFLIAKYWYKKFLAFVLISIPIIIILLTHLFITPV